MKLNTRSFMFIFLMTFLFFGMTWFFDSKKPKTVQEEVVSDEIAERTATLGDLPMARLYRDEKGEDFAGLAVSDNGFFVTIPNESAMPGQLYVLEGKGRLTKVSLKDQNDQSAIYQSQNAGSMPVVALGALGISDVQVIELVDNNQNGHVFVGEYSSSQIAFPGGKPRGPSIVVYKSGNQYLPMGTYSPKSGFTQFSQNFVAVQTPAASNPGLDRAEKFYVLENAYQQIVFSNIGGSIAEINLPFEGKDDTKSIVLPIGVDSKIQESSPANALFPAQSALGAGGTQVQPKEGGYYPLLRRGIFKAGGVAQIEVPPRYYALNIISDNPEVARTVYRMTSMGSDFIEFEGVSGGRRITKRFTLTDAYCLNLETQIDGEASGLWLTSGVPDVEIISNRSDPTLKYRGWQGERAQVEKVKLPKAGTTLSSIRSDWVCSSNGFFGLILDPMSYKPTSIQASKVPGVIDPTRLSTIEPKNKLYPADKYPGYEMLVPMKSGKQSYRYFSGPFERKLLQGLDKIFDETGANPNYAGAWSFHGWFSFISEPFAKFLFLVMQGFHAITHSWGLSIILLTLVLRLMLYPLNAWSIRSTLRMQKYQPQMAAIQKKMKSDPKKAQKEMMEFQREHKVNPFTGGCLPMLIQMPFLIGMFDLLKSAFDLRGVTFIPGWIDNLTAPDVLFSWTTPIPFFGTSFHLLPFLLGGVMFFNQKMMMQGKVKAGEEMDDKAKQAQTMGKIMPIVFTLIFYKFPSGLNLYWFSSMVLGMVQQKWMMNKQKKEPEVRSIAKPTKRLKKRRQ